jgi:hypothetical protein
MRDAADDVGGASVSDRWQNIRNRLEPARQLADEMHMLCERACEESMTTAEGARLEELLSSDPQSRAYYLEFMEMHGALQWGASSEWTIDVPPAKPVAAAAEAAFPTVANDGLGCASADCEPPPATLPCAAVLNQARRSFSWGAAISKPRFSLAMSLVVLLLAFTVVAAGERIIRAVFSHSVEAHPDGGLIRSNNVFQVGGSHRGTRRIGSSHLADMGLVNILVFRLPALREFDRIKSARLEWTYKERQGNPDFAADLYGLGYATSTSALSGCFWEGDFDSKRRTEYGMEGSKSRRVSLIKKAAMAPTDEVGRIVVQGPQLVAFLQSLYDDGAKGGELAVFRLNADVPTSQISRLQAYEMVHPPEVTGLTTAAEFPSLQLTADPMIDGNPTVAEVVLTAHGVEANKSSTIVRSNGKLYGGTSELGTRRIGTSATSDTSLANLLVFHLPQLREFERVRAAQLEWTFKARDGNPSFSVDLYGLGHTSSTACLTTCFWEGLYDSRLRSEYGMNGQSHRQVALVAKGAMTPRSRTGRITVEGPELVDFLQSLYDDGAGAGDLVVFRLNADVSTTQTSRGTAYQVVHPPERPGKTTVGESAVLHLISY